MTVSQKDDSLRFAISEIFRTITSLPLQCSQTHPFALHKGWTRKECKLAKVMPDAMPWLPAVGVLVGHVSHCHALFEDNCPEKLGQLAVCTLVLPSQCCSSMRHKCNASVSKRSSTRRRKGALYMECNNNKPQDKLFLRHSLSHDTTSSCTLIAIPKAYFSPLALSNGTIGGSKYHNGVNNGHLQPAFCPIVLKLQDDR